ncbi:MAG: MBL fold metallo-hydrolase [Gemmatimonadota bacterium]|nr:MBL fold metallo-hydrolase [Gemmatimonadota bacterium]MDH5284971.1 MBL fold metallo-hydrolase [Gemmatimonadota bacterium]
MALLLTVMVPGTALAQGMDTVTIVRQRAGDNVYMLTGRGGNIGVSAGVDGVVLIDDQFAPLAGKIGRVAGALSGRPIRFVINTHWHGDHTGGNEVFGSAGSLIVAHDNVRQRMSKEQFIATFNSRTPPAPAAALPVVTFSDTLSLYLNGDTLQAFHVARAHTDGDAIIRFRRANVFHMGDTFMNGFYPFIDVGSGGTLDGVIAAADLVLAGSDGATRIIPGHGPLARREDLKAFRDMLATVRTRLTAAKQKGMTLDQVVGADLLADLNPVWGDGFLKADQFVTLAWQSMGGR